MSLLVARQLGWLLTGVDGCASLYSKFWLACYQLQGKPTASRRSTELLMCDKHGQSHMVTTALTTLAILPFGWMVWRDLYSIAHGLQSILQTPASLTSRLAALHAHLLF
jgi:hypothetical protein